MSQSIVYIGFGGNLGDTRWIFRDAKEALSKRVGECTGTSRLYTSLPMTRSGEDASHLNLYLNGAASFQTSLSPEEVLALCMEVEKENGRRRDTESRWSSRSLDLDLLFFNDEVIDSETLIIPHPHLHERDFVLYPLADINPFLKHPVLHYTIGEMVEMIDEQERRYIVEVDEGSGW